MTVPSEVLSGKTELGQKFAGHLLRDEESNFLSRFLGREDEQKALGPTPAESFQIELAAGASCH
jgi:hypothetical protein